MLKSGAGWRFFEAPYHLPKPTRSPFFVRKVKNLWGGDDFTPKIQEKAIIVNGKKYGRKENSKSIHNKIKA